jgi:hypothetical protein
MRVLQHNQDSSIKTKQNNKNPENTSTVVLADLQWFR